MPDILAMPLRLGSRRAETSILAIGVLLVLLLPGAVSALTLPDPPAPNTTVNGPIANPKSSFTGGVLIKLDQQVITTTALNEPVATFECVDATKTVAKTVKSETGMSLQGPLSDAQTQGIIDAFNSVRPPKEVKLTTVVTGTATTVDTWTLTGINFQETTYDVYVITQASPAIERLVGYIVISVPVSLTTKDDQTPCPTPAPQPMIILGQDFHLDPPPSNPVQSFFDIFIDITRLPDDGIGPYFQYGHVNVYGGGGIAGTTNVRPGETVQMKLPPGSYDVKADVGVFGYHFQVDGGSFNSANPVILSVTLSIEAYIYTIIIVIFLIILIAILLILKRFWPWGRGTPEEPVGATDGGTQPGPVGGQDSPAPRGEQPTDEGEMSMILS
ncbi:MAG: hypothetical protein HY247_04600 [archaeon]|nr:MAG: hypothetical protein HY247_04600 [archaeon]